MEVWKAITYFVVDSPAETGNCPPGFSIFGGLKRRQGLKNFTFFHFSPDFVRHFSSKNRTVARPEGVFAESYEYSPRHLQ